MDGSMGSSSAAASSSQKTWQRIFPASCNWFCAQISSCCEGFLAFGARNTVYILDLSTRSFVRTLVGHTNKVTAVSFFPYVGTRASTLKTDESSEEGELESSPVASSSILPFLTLVSTSSDRTVRVWDVFHGRVIHQLPSNVHRADVVALSVSPLQSDLVVSGDASGHIVSWNYLSKGSARPTPFCPLTGAGELFCLSCSPHSASVVAIGYKSGAIIVADLNSRSMLRRLVGHIDEIHCLTWCPLRSLASMETSAVGDQLSIGSEKRGVNRQIMSYSDLVEPEATPAASVALLGSSSRDRSIRIWDTNTGKVINTLKLPAPQQQQQQKKGKDQQKTRLWLTMDWSPDGSNEIISSSNDGEVMRWDLRNPGRPTSYRLESKHTRPVFNFLYVRSSHDFQSPHRRRFAVSLSMDRTIGYWDIQSGKCLWVVPCIGGYVYSLEASSRQFHPHPATFTNLAIGIGDGSIRTWRHRSELDLQVESNLRRAKGREIDPYEGLFLWKGLQGKVTCVRWHHQPPSSFEASR